VSTVIGGAAITLGAPLFSTSIIDAYAQNSLDVAPQPSTTAEASTCDVRLFAGICLSAAEFGFIILAGVALLVLIVLVKAL
jgi:hypothetical protein